MRCSSCALTCYTFSWEPKARGASGVGQRSAFLKTFNNNTALLDLEGNTISMSYIRFYVQCGNRDTMRDALLPQRRREHVWNPYITRSNKRRRMTAAKATAAVIQCRPDIWSNWVKCQYQYWDPTLSLWRGEENCSHKGHLDTKLTRKGTQIRT